MRSHKRARVLGTTGNHFHIPCCSDCGNRMQKNDKGEWFCLSCADAWLGRFIENKTHGKSMGGVELPSGVRDQRRDEMTPSFRDLMPNRRARRAMRVR